MQYCPKCNELFENNEKTCRDCNLELEEISIQHLVTVPTLYDAEQMVQRLKAAGIVAYYKSEGLGGYLQIYQGFSNESFNLFVPSYDVTKAKDLLQIGDSSLASGGDNAILKSEEKLEDDLTYYRKRRSRTARILVTLSLGMIGVAIIIQIGRLIL